MKRAPRNPNLAKRCLAFLRNHREAKRRERIGATYLDSVNPKDPLKQRLLEWNTLYLKC